MALNSLFCADVPLITYSLTHSYMYYAEISLQYAKNTFTNPIVSGPTN